MLRYTSVKAWPKTATAAAIVSVAACAHGLASDFTTDRVMKDMTRDERKGYLAGVIEGLAFARYKKDGDKIEGMKCIYDWLYEKPDSVELIFSAFERFPNHTPGAVIAALVRKECGD